MQELLTLVLSLLIINLEGGRCDVPEKNVDLFWTTKNILVSYPRYHLTIEDVGQTSFSFQTTETCRFVDPYPYWSSL